LHPAATNEGANETVRLEDSGVIRSDLPLTARCVMTRHLVGVGVLLLAVAPGLAADPPGRGPMAADVKKLIDELAKVERPDMGYSASQSGSAFLPLGRSEAETILFGQRANSRSDAVRRLVKYVVPAGRKADRAAKDDEDRTPLDLAKERKNAGVVKVLE
jgi:hypothetical protein